MITAATVGLRPASLKNPFRNERGFPRWLPTAGRLAVVPLRHSLVKDAALIVRCRPCESFRSDGGGATGAWPASRGNWLGGTVSSWAEVTVRFLSGTNRVLASRTISPVGRARRPEFAPRAGGGVLPTGRTARRGCCYPWGKPA
jgi:hypothetical protein